MASAVTSTPLLSRYIGSTMNTKHKDEGTEWEHVVVETDDWSVFVSEDEDGELRINVPDHVQVRVNGEPKEEPTVSVLSNEFSTLLEIDDRENSFRRLPEPSP